MSWSSLPIHIDEPNEWKNKDDWNSVWMRWRIYVKGLFAYSYRSKYWWERWRRVPKLIWSTHGKGLLRFESKDSSSILSSSNYWLLGEGYYLSRQQRWCRWSVQVQWPAFFACHFYFKKESVPNPVKEIETDGKLVFFYVGSMFDSDNVYWFPSIFFGKVWK